MSDLILYTTEDGQCQITLRAKGQTVWLTQREMARLFDVSTDNVGLHLKNIYEDGELDRSATTEESSVVHIERSWVDRMDYFDNKLTRIHFPLLNNAGSVSHEQIQKEVSELYLEYDRQRKIEEVKQADMEDEAELKALEEKLKKRTTLSPKRKTK